MLKDMLPQAQEEAHGEGLRGAAHPARAGVRQAHRPRGRHRRRARPRREARHHLPRRDRQDRRRRGRRWVGPDVSREGVQRDLLPIVEGSNVQTKYGMVKTDHVLFIAAGAFHVSQAERPDSGAAGPLPDSRRAQAAHRGGLRPHHDGAGERAHQAVRGAGRGRGATLEFTPDGIAEIARIAAIANERMENIGARRLHTVMTTLLEDVLCTICPTRRSRTVTVNRGLVRDRLKAIVEDEDLRKYIL